MGELLVSVAAYLGLMRRFDQMINSKNQTPCLGSAYLSGQCNGGRESLYLEFVMLDYC
jgi:hypothetical protein